MPFNTPAGYEKVAHHMKDLPKEWNQVPMFIHVARGFVPHGPDPSGEGAPQHL